MDKEMQIKREVSQQTILGHFQMSPEQEEQMKQIVRDSIHAIAKLKNGKGQPLRWCYVPALPVQQNIAGHCLAMDFGCSEHYIKLCLCKVTSDRTQSERLKLVDKRAFILTPTVRHADMSCFSDFIALCVRQMLVDNGVTCTDASPTVHMGVAAGFDVRVKARRKPASATVLFASKDFKMNGFIGQDFVAQFEDAFKRINLNVDVVTVINDAVGILLSGIHRATREQRASRAIDCSIGVLCHRAGSNLAYLEGNQDFLDMCSLDQRLLLRRPIGSGFCVLVNSELGYTIGAEDELKDIGNILEHQLVKELKAVFRLECITSGTWYPMLLKKCINLLIRYGAITSYQAGSWTLDSSDGFQVFVECDALFQQHQPTSKESLAGSLSHLLQLPNLTASDAGVIAAICRAIVWRTAKVIALCIMATAECVYGALLPKMMGVAYGGSLFDSLTQLKVLLQAELDEIKPTGTEILLIHADVSLGCAVTAICSGLTSETSHGLD